MDTGKKARPTRVEQNTALAQREVVSLATFVTWTRPINLFLQFCAPGPSRTHATGQHPRTARRTQKCIAFMLS